MNDVSSRCCCYFWFCDGHGNGLYTLYTHRPLKFGTLSQRGACAINYYDVDLPRGTWCAAKSRSVHVMYLRIPLSVLFASLPPSSGFAKFGRSLLSVYLPGVGWAATCVVVDVLVVVSFLLETGPSPWLAFILWQERRSARGNFRSSCCAFQCRMQSDLALLPDLELRNTESERKRRKLLRVKCYCIQFTIDFVMVSGHDESISSFWSRVGKKMSTPPCARDGVFLKILDMQLEFVSWKYLLAIDCSWFSL